MGNSGRLRLPVAVLVLPVVLGASVLAIASAPEGSPVAIWWPAAGIGVALLVLTPRRWWWWLVPGILVATGTANLVEDRPLDLSAWLAAGNACEAVVAATFLGRRRTEPPELAGIDVFLRLVVASVLGGLTQATIAAAGIAVLADGSFPLTLRSLALSHAASILVVLPIVLAPPLRRGGRWARWDLPVQLVALAATTAYIFGSDQTRSLEFLALPLLIWAALRFDIAVVAYELAGFAVAVILTSSAGRGPFGFDFERGQVGALGLGAILQAFIVSSAVMALPLAIGIEQNRRLLRRLSGSERLTSATLDTTAAMILVTDLYGEVTRVNGATVSLTGFAEPDLVGRPVWEMPFAPPGSSGYPAGLPAEPDEQVSRETDLVTSDGSRRRILWNTGYVRDDRDRPTHVVITGTDLTRERRTAGINRHLLEAAITTALIGIDLRGRITVFNSGAVNLLGYDSQDIIGTPFVDLLDPAQLAQQTGGLTGDAAFERLVADVEDGGESERQDWTWVSTDGRRHTISMTISAVTDSLAPRYGYLCVGRDVTEARASQEMLVSALEKERLAVQRMREVDAVKSDFVATASHELRTPVTSIVGFTEMLEDGTVGEPTPEQRRLLASIARNGQRLIQLCNNLLTLGELDAGDTEFERERVDLVRVVAHVEDALRAQVAARPVDLVVEPATGPVAVYGDEEHLERVVTNLVGNAIKFTDPGGRVDISVSAVDGEARVRVADTGIGIPVEEQPQLFQRFFRSSSAKERAIQGTGLGLSIVDSIVAAHGGRIDVRSAHLAGTTFTVRLPLARG